MTTLAKARRSASALGAVSLGAVLTLTMSPAHAETVTEPTLTDLGPAAVGTAVNGAELVGDNLYIVSRQAVPSTLTTLNLESRTVTDVTTVPSGIEGWAATAVNDGRDLYFGMHTPADLYHFDIVTGELDTTPVATFPRELLVMDQTASPDGLVYIGGMSRSAATTEGGGVYAFDPSTGTYTDLGIPEPGQRYVRSIVANEETVFAGLGGAASIQYRDRSATSWTEISIPELEGESFVYDMALEGRYLTFGTEPSGLFGVVDLETSEVTVVPVPDGRTVDSIVMDGTTAYFTVRPEGKLYSYDIASATLTELALPSPGTEHRKLFVSEGRIIGVGGAGDVWFYDLATGEVDLLTSIESGMPRSPERAAQSLTVFEGDAYVGGHWGIQRHDGTSQESTRFAIPGETKTMLGAEGQLLASIYPASQVWTYDPASRETAHLASIRDNQMRPRTSHFNDATGKLLVGTREVYGNVGGALSVIDPDTGDISTYRDLSVDQAPVSIASIDEVAFIGHEIYGEVLPATTTEARLVSWNIEAAEKGWDIVPVPGAPAINALATTNTANGPILYGTTDTGWVFSVDPANGEVIDRVKPATRANDLVVNSTGVYTLMNGGIFRISSEADGSIVRELVDAGPFTHLAVDDTSDWRLYAVGIRTVDGTSQARLFSFEMPPTHSTVRWDVTSDEGAPLAGSTFVVTLADRTEVTVEDNGPLDADPDSGQFLFTDAQFGKLSVKQLAGADGYLLDKGTQHARTSIDSPSGELVFVNREHPGKNR